MRTPTRALASMLLLAACLSPAFIQMLEHDAAYAGGHYALALAAAERQDAGVVRRELAEAVALWKQADADLPELADARRRLAELGQ